MKHLNISYTLNRKVVQTIRLYTDNYLPYEIVNMLNSGKILISIQSEGKELILFKNGVSKSIGEIIETQENNTEKYSLSKIFDRHWTTKLNFGDIIK